MNARFIKCHIAIPLQVLTSPEVSRRVKLPDYEMSIKV
jgi:hypothetical protein